MVFHIKKILSLGDGTYVGSGTVPPLFELLLTVGNATSVFVKSYTTLANAKAGAVAQLAAGQSFTWTDSATESVSNVLPWL